MDRKPDFFSQTLIKKENNFHSYVLNVYMENNDGH